MPDLAAGTGGVEDLLEVGDPRKDRGNLYEFEVGCVGEEPGDGGLSGAGRTPEYHRTEGSGRQHPANGPRWPEQMVLSNNVLELFGTEAVRQWPWRRAIQSGRLEESRYRLFCQGANFPCPAGPNDPSPDAAGHAYQI